MTTPALVEFVQRRLSRIADPTKAPAMAAYMKTEMPFYGVQKPQREPIYREMKKRFVPADRAAYEAGVLALWRLPHREEKYAAITYASQHRAFIHLDSLPLYEGLIREGAWWDLVDPIASGLVGVVLLAHRVQVTPIMERWIEDPDMWIRRAAILSQLGHKADTDLNMLFAFCMKCAAEREFFIRKAIGWALREYSRTAPDAVRDFLQAHRDQLSGLSFREGAKRLVKAGLM